MRKVLLIGSVSMTLAAIVFAVPTSATDTTDAVDSVSIGVPISCSIEGTGMNSHTASVPNGTYQADIGTTTLKAYCNDDEGFAIFAVGYTGDEIGGANSTKLVGTNGSIVTGTATSGDTSNWAMKLATDSGATYAITLDNSFGSYSAVPASYTKVAHRDSGTDIGTGATGASLTTTYAAYMSQSQPAGTYTGQVIYTLVHPSSEEPAQPHTAQSGCINYFANASTAIGEMGCQTISKSATSATLWASNFKRTGYGFAGWSDQYNYATNPNANFYGPNQTITFTAGQYTGSNNGLSLYAVWVKSAGTIQNWNGCSSLTQAPTDGTATLTSVTALTDERDGNTYAIAKLADDKCWTIENLRLADKDSNNNDINLSSTNTHNPSIPLTNTYDIGLTSNHLSSPSSLVYDATNAPEGWCFTSSSACIDQSRLRTDNITLFTNNTSSSYSASSDVYSYGNYYNWYSATAGHGIYGTNYGDGYTALGDICPAGWHLPTGGRNAGEYYALNNAVNSSSTTLDVGLRVYPANFVYSGFVGGSSVGNRNREGHYWSASGIRREGASYLYFDDQHVHLGTYNCEKYIGKTVRCVAGV